ncbi:MAG: 5'/3'-nucleotidase SurE [Bacillota bacterium]
MLLTNDDGIDAPGLRALSARLPGLGWEVYVAAPATPRDASSHAITLDRDIEVEERRLPGASRAWSIGGTPVDCVKLALGKLVYRMPDLLVSGINHGDNLGIDVLYSGTVAAAREGCIAGVASVAVSLALDGEESAPWDEAGILTLRILTRLLPVLSRDVIFNVNLPPAAGEASGTRVTRLGRRRYVNQFTQVCLDQGATVLRFSGRPVDDGEDPHSDIAAIRNGLVSITPLGLDTTDLWQFLRFRTLADGTGDLCKDLAWEAPGAKPGWRSG